MASNEKDKETHLCDCDEKECSASFSNRLFHLDDQCIHVDGTSHKIKVKSNAEQLKIVCWNCGTDIIVYESSGYKGKRGRCPLCQANFPLE